jgi:hypothetical protein
VDSSRDNRNITDVNGRRETHKVRDAIKRRDANTQTVLASAGTPETGAEIPRPAWTPTPT